MADRIEEENRTDWAQTSLRHGFGSFSAETIKSATVHHTMIL